MWSMVSSEYGALAMVKFPWASTATTTTHRAETHLLPRVVG